MTPADQARENAIHCEMKKCALRQSKDGIIVSFVLHPHEVPKALQTADIGSRWMVALVELNDDETAIQQPAKEHPEPAAPGKGSWRDLQPAAQAGIRSHDPVFMAFMEERSGRTISDESSATNAIRQFCGVMSRSQLATNHKARILWHQLDEQFQAWKALERT